MSATKIVYLEYLRAICAAVVVLDHLAISAIHIFDKIASDWDRFVYNGIQHWSHFAVPVFLIISGYLLLEPTKPIDYKKAIGQYAKRMGIVLLLIGTLFAYMELFFASKSFSFTDIGEAVYLTLIGNTWNHMWYLYVLIGIYLVLPVLKPIYKHLPINIIDTFLVLMFVFCSILPIVKQLSGFSLGVTLPVNTIFLFYFLLGGRLRLNNDIRWIGNPLVVLSLMIIPLASAYFEFIKGYVFLEVLSSYTSPIIALLALSIFKIVEKYNSQSFNLLGGVK